MIVDASPTAQLELLRRAALEFEGGENVAAFAEATGGLAFAALGNSDELVGWCWGHHLIRPDAPAMLYLHELEVVQEHRRQGHGRALLDAFIAAGKAAGATKMFLFTAAANQPARRLYESIGGGLAAHGPTVNYWFSLR